MQELSESTWGGARAGAGHKKGIPSVGSGRTKIGGGRKQVQISLSMEKYERYKNEAEKRGMNFSAFIVDCIEKSI